jgi:hypothetical protein
MNPLWLKQIGAVLRLEIKKTFLARRGLWIYLLALIPVVIWSGHAWEMRSKFERRRQWSQISTGATREKMAVIKPQMTREEVDQLLGRPAWEQQWRNRRRDAEFREGEHLGYADGYTELRLTMHDNKVVGVIRNAGCPLSEDVTIFAGIFQFFYLRLAIFFGCLFVFINLFRGEMLDKSLHYYFLSPVRREVIVAGKFLAGLLATVVIFTASTALQLGVMNWHFETQEIEGYITRGDGWWHAFSYLGVTALACFGYGSVFLASGILLRNPLIPGVTILLWESINGILPAALRKVSIIYYLKSLCPVEIPIDRGVPPPLALLAMTVDPAPPLLAIGGLLLVACTVLFLAARKARTLEINYGTE